MYSSKTTGVRRIYPARGVMLNHGVPGSEEATNSPGVSRWTSTIPQVNSPYLLLEKWLHALRLMRPTAFGPLRLESRPVG